MPRLEEEAAISLDKPVYKDRGQRGEKAGEMSSTIKGWGCFVKSWVLTCKDEWRTGNSGDSCHSLCECDAL